MMVYDIYIYIYYTYISSMVQNNANTYIDPIHSGSKAQNKVNSRV